MIPRMCCAQRRAARATLVARQLCPAEDVVFQDEQIAMVLHERLQNAPPLFDQLARVGLLPNSTNNHSNGIC